MNNKKTFKILTVLFVVVLCCGPVGLADPLGTAFTYQGRLIDNEQPAAGLYDLQFKLYDAESAGSQVGDDANTPGVDVSDGYFTVELDFGNVFDGNNRWLEIGVRPGELGDPNLYTSLSPRQLIAPTPYALYALNGGGSLWQVNGTSIYYNNGNVGIGTTSPAQDLEVKGGVFIDHSGGAHVPAEPGIALTVDGRAGKNILRLRDSEANTAMVVNHVGKVGIGTSSPTAKLEVNGQVRITDGSQAAGKVLTSDSVGLATWQTLPAAGDSDWTISGTNMYSGVSGNVGIGTSSPAAKLDVSGDINVASVYKIGGNTVLSVAGTTNTLVGVGAGAVNTGTDNTFSGYLAGYLNTTGYNNTFAGRAAGYSNDTGHNNIFSGGYAGFSNTIGNFNTFSGYGAGQYNVEGNNNTFLGFQSGYSNTTGSSNTFSGYQAGYSNTTGYSNIYLGSQAGYSNSTGSGNTFLGYKAGYSETGSNKLYIANDAADANVLIYGDFSTGRIGLGTKTLNYRLQLPNIAGAGGQGQANAWQTYSSRRWKTDIQPIENALGKVQGLRGVYFDWKSNGKHDIGMIAEEVAEVIPEVVGYEDNSKDVSSMDYARLVALLVEAVKEQQKEIADLKTQQGGITTLRADKDAQIESLTKANEDINARLAAMESLVAKLSLQKEGGIK